MLRDFALIMIGVVLMSVILGFFGYWLVKAARIRGYDEGYLEGYNDAKDTCDEELLEKFAEGYEEGFYDALNK